MASSQPVPHDIVLFCYDESVFSRRIERYLDLRGIKYDRCIQPPYMPRPDLAALGINYRRIPVLAIGSDVYMDTRIMIEKLEDLYPETRLGTGDPFEHALAKILESWTIDGGPFWRTAGCIPLSARLAQDPVWIKDRLDGSGGGFTPERLVSGRPENLANLGFYFSLAEQLLADGRRWVLDGGGEAPGLADVQGIWPFDWATNLGLSADSENVGEEVLNAARFPHVFGWIDRFRHACEQARATNGEPKVISSRDALDRILAAASSSSSSDDDEQASDDVDASDPLQLAKGQRVKIGPSDFGFTHSDVGDLLSLSTREVVIAVKVRDGDGTLRLHYPRTNFRITPVEKDG